MQEKCFLKNRSGFRISAIFSKPKDSKPDSVVIMCHGLDFSKDSKANIALDKIFVKHNIATFQIDFFGHGESQGNKSDANVAEFVDNVLQSIEYVKNFGYKNIGIYGASFGGIVSVIAASRNSDLKVMALKAAGMGHTARKMQQYKKDFDTKSWIKAGIKVKIPTLILHGTSDEKVEIECGEELSKSITTAEFRSYSGADHGFTKKEDFERMIHDISDFIIKHIR